MKAAVVEKIRDARVLEVEDPKTLPGSMKIRVEACAVCGSDLRIFTKGDPRATFPRIIGHEIAGTIVELGEGTTGYAVGDRVCVAPGHGCGECKYCKNDMGNVCVNPQPSIGYASSGGFAQYIVPPVNVVKNGFVNRIPDNLSFEEASMSELLACCINAQERAMVGEGDTVLVIGPGPAGCMHIQLARARGAKKVLLSGRTPGRLQKAAERFHPDAVFTEQGDALVERVLAETDGLGADVVIVAAPSHETQEVAIKLAAPRGRVNFFGGLPKDNCISHIEANIIHYKEVMLTGASSSLGRQNREALQLISEGKVKASDYITHRYTLDEFNEAFAAVEGKDTIKAVLFPLEDPRGAERMSGGYAEARDLILKELAGALGNVEETEVSRLVRMICDAEKVFVVGVGRVLLMLQALAKRLNHLGIEANFVGAIDEPAITDRDLLLVGSGSGESAVPLAIVKIAKRYNAKIAHIGSNPNSSMAEYEDLFVRVPCRTKLNLPGEIASQQPMSSLFEQSLLLLGDTVAMLVMQEKGLDDLHALWKKHANLE